MRGRLLDVHIVFVDASDPDADLGPDLTQAAALARFHVRDASGQLISGAAGFARIWLTLPRWRWAGRIARLPLIRTLLEILYRAFLPIRPYLARLVTRKHT